MFIWPQVLDFDPRSLAININRIFGSLIKSISSVKEGEHSKVAKIGDQLIWILSFYSASQWVWEIWGVMIELIIFQNINLYDDKLCGKKWTF